MYVEQEDMLDLSKPIDPPSGLLHEVVGPSHRPQALHCKNLPADRDPLAECYVRTEYVPQPWFLVWERPVSHQNGTVLAHTRVGPALNSAPGGNNRRPHYSRLHANRRKAAGSRWSKLQLPESEIA